MCSNHEVSDKKLYPTFARTFAVDRELTPSVYSLLKYFKWNRLAIVYENVTKWVEMKNYMVKTLREKGVNVTVELAMNQSAVYRPQNHSERYRSLFKKIKAEARSKFIASNLKKTLLLDTFVFFLYACALGLKISWNIRFEAWRR